MKVLLIVIILLLIVAFFIEPISKYLDKKERKDETEVRNFKN